MKNRKLTKLEVKEKHVDRSGGKCWVVEKGQPGSSETGVRPQGRKGMEEAGRRASELRSSGCSVPGVYSNTWL